MNSLNKRLLFNLYYFGTWTGYFIISRIVFLIYYTDKTAELDLKTLIQIPIQGLKLDTAFSAYLAAIPFLIICFSIWIPNKITKPILKTFTFSLVFFINLLMFSDLALYGPWGIRLDSTPLIYINTPSEMLASLNNLELITSTSLWIASSLFYVFIFNKTINKSLNGFQKGSLWNFPILLLLTGSLIVVMRGGLQNTPINHSSVYFSEEMFANHAAVNFAWNFSNSISSQSYDMENPFKLMDLSEAKKNYTEAKKTVQNSKNDSIHYNILKTKRPNIILIIWESFTAKIVAPLGGEANVTENFNKLTKEGLLFTNFYANGDRSDKGLVAILSGYSPQPHKSVIKMPNKTRTLPTLTQKIKDLGYTTSYYHGGDLNFGNMKTYLRSGGINNFVDEDDFDPENANSKWGIHDHVVLERFLNEIPKKQASPFFNTLFTLSSHEPFEFPDTYKFGSDTYENKFRSSHAYTDKAIGNFIENAKKEPWWNNTLIIITADHGHAFPKHTGAFNSPKKFHIPMLWLGGALNQTNTTNTNIASQTDIAYTLLSLLDGDYASFEWGTNIFKKSPDHFAHYIFNKGFGTLNKDGLFVYDYLSKKPILEKGESSPYLEKLGKAITQTTYQDFLERK